MFPSPTKRQHLIFPPYSSSFAFMYFHICYFNLISFNTFIIVHCFVQNRIYNILLIFTVDNLFNKLNINSNAHNVSLCFTFNHIAILEISYFCL